jgi:hypothetical protein
MNKVDKRKVKRDVAILADVIDLLKQAEKKLKKKSYGCFYAATKLSWLDIQDMIEEAEKLHAGYSEQLVCKHQNTDEIETVNGHTGVHDFDVVCNTCKFVLDSY